MNSESVGFVLVVDRPFELDLAGPEQVLGSPAGFAEDLEVEVLEVPLGGGSAVAGGVDGVGWRGVVFQVLEHDQEEFGGGAWLKRPAAVWEVGIVPGEVQDGLDGGPEPGLALGLLDWSAGGVEPFDMLTRRASTSSGAVAERLWELTGLLLFRQGFAALVGFSRSGPGRL